MSATTLFIIIYLAGLLSGAGFMALISFIIGYKASQGTLDFHVVEKAADTVINKIGEK